MKPSRLFRRLARWHRWIGLATSLFILWLTVTGVLIHHAPDLGFDRAAVHSGWLLDHYRIGTPEITAFDVAGNWVSQAGKSLYVGEVRVAELVEPIVGAASVRGVIAVASPGRLLLFDEQATMLESLGREHGLPAGVRSIGRRGAQIVIETPAGQFAADPEELTWRPAHGVVAQTRRADPPPGLKELLVQDARSREISHERLLRDLHGGSFFGVVGKWLVDLAALALLALTLTGIWIWVRARQEFGGAKPTKPAARDQVRARLSR